MTTKRCVRYLQQYADEFSLWDHIHLDTPVVRIRRKPEGGHIVTYAKDGKEKSWEVDAVAICSGLHVQPSIPVGTYFEAVPTFDYLPACPFARLFRPHTLT